jgi:V/A-type H+-transporting ATPase subunit A
MFTITAINGPVVSAKVNYDEKPDFQAPKILEIVLVGPLELMGEIIAIDNDEIKIQVYEETIGLMVGEKVVLQNELLNVELAPGLVGEIFDGIQRPLKAIDEVSPIFIAPGIRLPKLDRNKVWEFIPTVQIGEQVEAGSRIGYVQETSLIKHWIMVPADFEGEGVVEKIETGNYTIEDVVAVLSNGQGRQTEVKMLQKSAVKKPRPYAQKLSATQVFKTGQRVIDTMFPIMLGAKVSTPGPFGAGKTFTQQQLAKWSDAEMVVYVGCGERGNEMTEMVKLFPTLQDPRTGKPLMDRTILIANTSNMPIAAREASVYTGITIAEYFRDQGYNVVLMADSTSRWCEAMREVSQRLGEMPSEEGYPAYMSSRIAGFYERAGVVEALGGQQGSVTVVGTVSPAGGDFSEPITQTSLKNSQVFLALDAGLASKRHYPSINWTQSYSLYEEQFAEVITKEYKNGVRYLEDRILAKQILNKEGELLELVKIVGMDGLDNNDRLTLEIGKSLREDFLQQNGFDKVDTYCPFEKNMFILRVIIGVYEVLKLEIESDVDENFIADYFDAETKKLLGNLKYKESLEEIENDRRTLINKVEVANVRV